MAKQKKYNIKIFDPTGTLISTIQPELILSDIEFDSQLNGGVGTVQIELDLTFDDFENQVSYIDVHNSVKIFEFDDENQDGQLIFTGEIIQPTPKLKVRAEMVTLLCQGLSAMFNVSVFKQGASFAPSYSGVDPSAIATDIVDQVIALTPFLTYEDTAIPSQTVFSVGTNVTVDFDPGTSWFDAMQIVAELAGDGWNWFVDGQGRFWFRSKPTTPTHVLQIGDDVGGIENEEDGAEIVNDVTIVYDTGTFNKTDASSIATYGTREAYIDDQNIKDATTAEQRADTELRKANPVKRVEIEINSKFNFEGISVGDTLKVRGLKSGSITLDPNSLIVGFFYGPDTMIVSLGEYTSLATEIAKIA